MSTLEEAISHNPATGEELGRSALDTVESLVEKLRWAAAAQPAWAGPTGRSGSPR